MLDRTKFKLESLKLLILLVYTLLFYCLISLFLYLLIKFSIALALSWNPFFFPFVKKQPPLSIFGFLNGLGWKNAITIVVSAFIAVRAVE